MVDFFYNLRQKGKRFLFISLLVFGVSFYQSYSYGKGAVFGLAIATLQTTVFFLVYFIMMRRCTSYHKIAPLELLPSEHKKMDASGYLQFYRNQRVSFFHGFGYLNLTNKRLVFRTNSQIISLPLASIVAVHYEWGMWGIRCGLALETQEGRISFGIPNPKQLFKEINGQILEEKITGSNDNEMFQR